MQLVEQFDAFCSVAMVDQFNAHCTVITTDQCVCVSCLVFAPHSSSVLYGHRHLYHSAVISSSSPDSSCSSPSSLLLAYYKTDSDFTTRIKQVHMKIYEFVTLKLLQTCHMFQSPFVAIRQCSTKDTVQTQSSQCKGTGKAIP